MVGRETGRAQSGRRRFVSARPRLALVLTGGGARGAYQVGVLKAVAKLLPEGSPNPFSVITGVSAGAINAAVLAIYARRFQEGVRRLVWVWENFHVNQIFRTDGLTIARSALHWLAALGTGGLGRHNPRSLLDNGPLRALLAEMVPCEKIQDAIEAGALHAVAVTASGYCSGDSVTFYQGAPGIPPWRRERRVGSATRLTHDHLLASAAIPLIFPAVKVAREYFGDGSMRLTAPLSPALHLGADRLLVIGVRRERPRTLPRECFMAEYPTLGQVAGFILDTLFLDTLYTDLERLRRINKTISLIPDRHLEEEGITLRQVEALHISPKADLAEIAGGLIHHFPRGVRYLLRGVGGLQPEGRGLASYLLFERPFTQALIKQGFQDAMAQRDALLPWLAPAAA